MNKILIPVYYTKMPVKVGWCGGIQESKAGRPCAQNWETQQVSASKENYVKAMNIKRS